MKNSIDTIRHSKLFIRLKSHGIAGNLLGRITHFLRDRCQITLVGDEHFSEAEPSRRIIQGSCIGPLLFMIYIHGVS